MRIGKKLHTENKKKVYRKPVVEVVEVDREIILLTGTGPSDPLNLSPDNSTNQKSAPDKPSYKDQYSNDNNPFGGGSPDFER